MKTVILDNYDSFTFNLYQMVAEVNGEVPLVIRNDQLAWAELQTLAYDNLIISPGPGRPEQRRDFGICAEALREAHTPVLGVCLGHQGIAAHAGGTVTAAPEVMHGRLSAIYHNEAPLFTALPQAFLAVRYHSLLVAQPLPACLEATAWTSDGLLMGLRHRERPLWGVQFHPESICTEHGYRLLANFRALTAQYGRPSRGRRSWAGYSCVPAGAAPPPTATASTPTMRVYSRRLERLYDPEQVFTQLFGAAPYAFWLDSSRVEPGLARFSFMGDTSGPHSQRVQYDAARRELHITQGNRTERRDERMFAYLKQRLAALACRNDELPFNFNCGFVGYVGYELHNDCGFSAGHRAPLDDACVLFADRVIAFDQQAQTTYLVCFDEAHRPNRVEAWFAAVEQQLKTLQPLDELSHGVHPQPFQWRLARSQAQYLRDIHECQRLIRAGETYEVCLTNQLHAAISLEPLALYRTLRRINPAPYAAYLRLGANAVLCSSPERFLQIDRDGWVESKPIKGTQPRGTSEPEDAAQRQRLQTSQKDRAENLMIVDLVRNDLGLVCAIGSVSVPKLMQVETYATVHQLVSTIRGRLRADMRPLDCLQHAFPGGSMTGAPKLRTMAIISALEQQARGIYAGALGYLGLNQTADLNIVIRTIVMTPNALSIGVGGAIVALSEPEAEFAELLLKAQALIQAIMRLARTDGDAALAQLEQQLRHHGVADV